ncbi:polysaccharide lyase family 7 protein [Gramella sp. AN32]|uniref:Polysaccharide lyase family 7 protein n=1 Tax=Christiangramia antarctica TaxID=2058158 RepID=A0ABW5XBE7_9FLAO|nr:polysaccharide lyase family 7 protein [Gramella sp. AN32]MCM4155489.1 polysaccharide lyase family 7 protein [Gramella sp. AN32]
MIRRRALYNRKFSIFIIVIGLSWISIQCQGSGTALKNGSYSQVTESGKKYKLPEIDLSHWKVTIPEGKGKGGAISVEPPEILEYATNETLKPYMYNDSTSGALVFYAYPSEATTANTKYSRSELREQMTPGNDDVNWTFKQGGNLKATIEMEDISRDEEGKYHKVIILQIHGRLSDAQKEKIGQKDNNAPPVLKIYWDKGKIRVKTKELKFPGTPNEGLLYEEAWSDDEGYTFEEEVGFKKFDVEIDVSEGKMLVSLNKNEFKAYDNIHMQKWGVFENYFKAGNYLQTRDKDAFAKVKFYDLKVSH